MKFCLLSCGKLPIIQRLIILRGIPELVVCTNRLSHTYVKNDLREVFKKNLREPPGYVASQRWMMQRPPDDRLERVLFGWNKTLDESGAHIEEKFMSNMIEAIVSGEPTKGQFQYTAAETTKEIPNLDYRLLENLCRMGLQQLTPVQRHAIGILSMDEHIRMPPTMDTNDPDDGVKNIERVVGLFDLMATAQTGSGKTLAYLIPIINRLLRVYPYEAMQKQLSSSYQNPSGLILAPTRELVQQILSEAAKLCYRSFVRPVGLFGGEPPSRQLFELARGCHMIVATPGRLLDFLNQGVLRLDFCRSLVLDEADRMLDMGFEPQLRNILEAPQFGMPPPSGSQRQTSLYSATFPRSVTILAHDFLRGSRCISLSISDSSNMTGLQVPDWGRTSSRRASDRDRLAQLVQMVPREINQSIEFVSIQGSSALDSALIKLVQTILNSDSVSDPKLQDQPLENLTPSFPSTHSQTPSLDGRILIFCNTKRQVDEIDALLYRFGLKSASIHGDKPQQHRTRALDLLRRGKINVLVASSVAARGLDIPHVRAVINIGFPTKLDDYVHRIGRTGRMGRSGQAITLVNRKLLEESIDSVAEEVCNLVQHYGGAPIPHEVLEYATDNKPSERKDRDRSKGSYRREAKDWNQRRRTNGSMYELDRRYGR